MLKFYNKLERYINKHFQKEDSKETPLFKYQGDTFIAPEIAVELYNNYLKLTSLQQLWEKEKDYSRLLKKENLDLQEELNSICYVNEEDSFQDEDDLTSPILSEEKEYLS